MKYVKVTRRQLLRGVGGSTLALPLLPSLLPGPAYAVTYALAARPCFAAMTTVHGAIGVSSMYPSTQLSQSMQLYSGHTVKWGTLPATSGQISAVLKGAALTPKLIAKMNVLQGFDIPYYIGHHSGGHLGNYVRSDQGPQNLAPFASIDQVMAWSNGFYPDLTGVKMRSIVAGHGGFGGGPSFAYANPTAKTGAVNGIPPEGNAATLFDKLFAGGGAPAPGTPAPAPRKPIVDRVLANYKSLRESNRRLSADDKLRLDAHVSLLGELQRTLADKPPAGGGATPAMCSNVPKPAFDGSLNGFGPINSVIALAFACGTSRIATLSLPSAEFANYGGNWHQDVAHNWPDPGKQALLVGAAQRSFEGVFLDLIKKLDAQEIAPGVTALDASLVQWTQESGWGTHDAQEMPIITAGGANGFFKTGLHVDYRSGKHMKMFGSPQQQSLGLLHRQWLATALLAMGVPAAEFEKNGKAGYGDPFMSPDYAAAVPAETYNNASKPVPVITTA